MNHDINVALEVTEREEIAKGLSRFLADSYLLYIKTHNFHWNVTGPLFSTLHQLFEQQYMDLATAVDLIAERIRALGLPAPGSYAQFSELAHIEEETGVPLAQDMIGQLVYDNELLVRTAKKVFPLAEKAGDQPTADLLTQRMQVHEKNAWMLRSMLG